LLNIGYVIYEGLNWRKEIGGAINYGSAFKFGFLILVVNGLLSSFLLPLILILADSSYPDTMIQSQIDTSIYWAQKMGAPEEALEDMRDKMDTAELGKSYTPFGALKGFGVAILFYALGSLITSIFVKKEPEAV
jgi:hypothetical protein